MLRLEALPAGNGDCLWLEWGNPSHPHIALIDGGVADTATLIEGRIRRAMEHRKCDKLHIDLLIVTHIDNDHIGGILELLERDEASVTFGDIWFNGDRQLSNLLGPAEGDRLSKLLAARALPWNLAFNGGRAEIPDEGILPTISLCTASTESEMKLTLLGPTSTRLNALASVWANAIGGVEPDTQSNVLGRGDRWPPKLDEREVLDDSVTNASSIIVLAEYRSWALLLSADALPQDLLVGIVRILRQRNPKRGALRLDAIKIPHHGSARNLSRALLSRIDCRNYLISTDGSGSARHPDYQTLLRIIRYSGQPPTLMFNYESERTAIWKKRPRDISPPMQDYEVRFPEAAGSGLILQFDN
jgi:hypothetical protein